MKRILLTFLVLILGPGAALAQSPFQEGTHYTEVERPAGFHVIDGVMVTEVFSYLCNHCMTFEPFVQNWRSKLPEGVVFSRIPVEFGRATWGLYARAYVAASVMGIEDQTHVPMMDTIWKERKQMRSMDELADFYAGFGVEKDKFLATVESFAVDMQMRREQQMVREYGITGTPSMMVNGKYRVSAGGAISNFDVMLAVVDYLVAREMSAEVAQQEIAETEAAVTD